MNLHDFKELDFDEALELLETRLIGLKGDIKKLEEHRDSSNPILHNKAKQELELLQQYRADIEDRLIRLKATELAGEKDNLLTEIFSIFDQAGERIEQFLKSLGAP